MGGCFPSNNKCCLLSKQFLRTRQIFYNNLLKLPGSQYSQNRQTVDEKLCFG